MAYISINGDRNILDDVVITKFEILLGLLEVIDKNPGISQSDLRRKTKFSGGKIYTGVKGLKAMRLAENGSGLRIKGLGVQLLKGPQYNNPLYINNLKEACLNVPLFKEIYAQNKNEKTPRVLFKLFERKLEERYKEVDPKLIGSAVRRYLQGIYDIKLPISAEIQPREERKKVQRKSPIDERNGKEIILAIKSLKKELQLSDREIQILINSLPEKKKEEVQLITFSKVF